MYDTSRVENNWEWLKSHDADLDRFAELLIAAKGSRSMRTFAMECGVTPAAFSRIVKKLNKGASSVQLLESIAKHADPQSGVSMDELAAANGYKRILVMKDVFFPTEKRDLHYGSVAHERVARDILVQELLNRGASFRILPNKCSVSQYRFVTPDILLETDAFGKGNELWFVECPLGFSLRPETVFDRIGRYLMIDISREKEQIPIRFSIVISEAAVYESIVHTFQQRVIPINMSFILIDRMSGTVVAEAILPHSESGQQKSFFMDNALAAEVPTDSD